MPNAVPTVLYKRWAASTSYGVSGARARTGDAFSKTEVLVFFELALRYRIVRQLEVGLSGGGSLSRSSGFATIDADLRYRLYAERPWNPFLYGSAGIAQRGPRDPAHLALRVGGGIERRFQQWAFDGRIELTRFTADDTGVTGSIDERDGAWVASVAMSALYYWGSGGPSLRHHGVP